MANQVKSAKGVDTRPQQSIADTSEANTWRLSHSYLITNYCVKIYLIEAVYYEE